MTISGWMLRRISGPESEPLTLAQAKAQSNIDPDITAWDLFLTEAIEEARDATEKYLQATLCATRYVLEGSSWPCDPYAAGAFGAVVLPMGPVLQVDSVSYLDRDGARQVLGPAAYTLTPAGFVVPAFNTQWPFARLTPGSIAIEYTAGWQGDGSPEDASGVPRAIRRGLKMLVAHWFENREAILTGTISKELEQGYKDAIQAYRNYP